MTAPKPCRCKRARHEHGTLGAYNRDRCRCFPCRVAHARASASYRSGGQWRETPRRSAHGTRLRLQALAVIGWSASALAQQSTINASHLSKLRGENGQEWVSAAIGDEVTRLYNALWDKPRSDINARRCATQARTRGWLLPMELDDDELEVIRPAIKPGRRIKATPECGSHAAFNRHRREGVKRSDIDPICKQAERDYQRDRMHRNRQADSTRRAA